MVRQATSTFPVSQCKFTSTIGIGPGWPPPAPVDVSCPAKRLQPQQRQGLAIQVLAGMGSVSALARRHDLSRKFLYQQVHTAEAALNRAFAPSSTLDDALFYLPVTKAWLRQLVVALVLICHSSYRGVVELLSDLFDYPMSLGTVHNIVCSVVAQARRINQRYDLSGIRIGAHDEIFQASDPVLVGVDTASTFCYLLSLEGHRDAETWGIRLLELVDRGFAPEATVGDGGSGLRAGQGLALPEVPCRGDHFHLLHDFEAAVNHLERRAYGTIDACEQRGREQARQQRRGKPLYSTAQRLRRALAACDPAVALYDDVALLLDWLGHDILSVAGPAYAQRCLLYDFVTAELLARVPLCPHRLGPVHRSLKDGREEFLAFAKGLDDDLARLASEFQCPAELLRGVLQMLSRGECNPRRWEEETVLRHQLRGRFHEVCEAVAELEAKAVRASSLVENLNSRLRSYFFLRRQLGAHYLSLLQFFLNHRRFERSDRPERVGRSPAELLTGQPHPHWLSLLGFERFQRS
jgi:transposase-like protein